MNPSWSEIHTTLVGSPGTTNELFYSVSNRRIQNTANTIGEYSQAVHKERTFEFLSVRGTYKCFVDIAKENRKMIAKLSQSPRLFTRYGQLINFQLGVDGVISAAT